MWFKAILLDGWPMDNSSEVEIQDPSDENEVLSQIKPLMPSIQQSHRVEMMRSGERLNLLVRERPNGAVMGHFVSC